jgi:HPt (histidine-containing phosphotransfer) domain-containing protein
MAEVSSVLEEYRAILEQDEFEQLVRDLIDSFFEVTPKQLDQLRSAQGDNDEDAFKRAAHTLKSSGDTFGFNNFRSMAAELEQRGCSTNEYMNNQLISRLEIEFARVKSNLIALRESMQPKL